MNQLQKHSSYLASLLFVVLIFLFIKPVLASGYSTTTQVNVTVNSVISLSSSGSVNITSTPQSNGVQSANSDLVSVSTTDQNGYTLQLSSSSNISNSLSDGQGHYIPATSNTYSSPGILNANSWGFCSVSINGFVCPTTTFSNQTISSTYTFAKVPIYGSPVTLKTTSSSATNDTTTVWYSASIDTSQISGTYSGIVEYIASGN